MPAHKCKHFTPAHRRQRRCKTCNRKQWKVDNDWRWSMSLEQFAEKWLPAISGVRPQDMMTVKVAFPFEWNCYESWKIVFKVLIQLPEVDGRRKSGLGTRTDVMNGWTSGYQEDFALIDAEAENYYKVKTGHPYLIGDNTYSQMRAIIQS